MRIKTSIVTMLTLSVVLLTGCNVHYGTCRNSSQATDDGIGTTGERPDNTPETIRLREDLRVANERAKLAEEQAEREKRLRGFAEERVKQLEKSAQEGKPEDSSEDEDTGGS